MFALVLLPLLLQLGCAYEHNDPVFEKLRVPSFLDISYTGTQVLGAGQRWQAAFGDNDAIIESFQGTSHTVLSNCFQACADSQKCKGLFAYSPALLDFRCVTLNKLGPAIATGTKSLSMTKRGVKAGCTGFDDNNQPCHIDCQHVGTCFFGFCGALENFHAPKGATCLISSSPVAPSFGQCQTTSFCMKPTAAPPFWDTKQYVQVANGGRYSTINTTSRRFQAAFTSSARLATINDVAEPFTACFDACNDRSDCSGVFIWDHPSIALDHVCYLLDSKAVSSTVPTSTDSYSFARSILGGYQADGVAGMGSSSNGKRFSTAFTSTVRLADLAHVTEEECAIACNANTQCQGFFWWQQTETLVRCFLLKELGGLVPTGSTSRSYRKL